MQSQIKRKMREHIKDTYLIMCKAKMIDDYLYLRYSEGDITQSSAHILTQYVDANTLSDRYERANRVKDLIFDYYNIYNPIIEKLGLTDWCNNDFHWLKE